MKHFIKGVVAWKTSACLLYTATMVIYLFFCTVFAQQQVSLAMLWMLLAVSLAGTLLQGICFSGWVIRKMRYSWRSVLFVVLFYPLLSLIAWKAAWFPANRPGAWVTFTGIFFFIFFAMTVGFEIYFQATGKKYDGLIGQYRRQQEASDRD